ncbi:MAG: type I-A CRISPR-associated protein Cas5, partial [Archaeoglobaceae archaeon]
RVSAVNVEKVSVEMKEGVVRTTFSFPIDFGIKELNELEPRWDFEVYMNPYIPEHKDPVSSYFSGKKALPFRVPIVRDPLTPPEFEVRLEANYVAYFAKDETVIGCRK